MLVFATRAVLLGRPCANHAVPWLRFRSLTSAARASDRKLAVRCARTVAACTAGVAGAPALTAETARPPLRAAADPTRNMLRNRRIRPPREKFCVRTTYAPEAFLGRDLLSAERTFTNHPLRPGAYF